MRLNTILRFDDEMLVTLRLWAQPTRQAPLLHLRRQSEDGLFDRFAAHFDALWRDVGIPLDADNEWLHPEHDEQPSTQADRAPAASDQLADQNAPVEAPGPADRPGQLRWPGRNS